MLLARVRPPIVNGSIGINIHFFFFLLQSLIIYSLLSLVLDCFVMCTCFYEYLFCDGRMVADIPGGSTASRGLKLSSS